MYLLLLYMFIVTFPLYLMNIYLTSFFLYVLTTSPLRIQPRRGLPETASFTLFLLSSSSLLSYIAFIEIMGPHSNSTLPSDFLWGFATAR